METRAIRPQLIAGGWRGPPWLGEAEGTLRVSWGVKGQGRVLGNTD